MGIPRRTSDGPLQRTRYVIRIAPEHGLATSIFIWSKSSVPFEEIVPIPLDHLLGGQGAMPAIILENIGEVGEVDGIPPTGSEIVVVVDKHPRMMTVIRHRWTIPLNPNHPGECTAIIVRPKE